MMHRSLGASVILVLGLGLVAGENVTEPLFCRDSWFTNITLEAYAKITCSKCYVQVFFDSKILTIAYPPVYPFPLVSRYGNESYMSDSEQAAVCERSLSAEECERWTACCEAAVTCCRQHGAATTATPPAATDKAAPAPCPATWDGVGCWPPAAPGATLHQACPAHYTARPVQWLHPESHKACNVTGQWAVHPTRNTELTDYFDCFDASTNTAVLRAALYLDIAGHLASILLLLASVIIMTAFRNLRLELLGRDSVRIHFNLFFAMLALGVATIANDVLLHAGLQHPDQDTAFDKAGVWCKLLHVLAAYFRSATYMCMFCEGLYLYKRISNVMKVGVQDPLAKYYIIGWGMPAVWVGTYIIARFAVLRVAESCVAEGEFYYIELIHIVPNLLSLGCNLVFLVSIEFMLCTKLRSDKSDRRLGVLRHALRATLSLIPIFGVQFLFIIYRPEYWPPYEVISAVFTSTQGALVAILYCFTNNDVKQELSAVLSRRRNRGGRCCHERTRGLSVCSTATKASRLSVPNTNTIDSMKNTKPASKTPMPTTSTITSIAPARRRESNWSQVTTNTFLNSSIGGGSGNSLALSSIASNSNISRSGSSSTPPMLRRGSRSRSSSNPSESSLARAAMDTVAVPSRPVTLNFELMEMTEPLMERLPMEVGTGGPVGGVVAGEETTSLTDIEEEKMLTSPLTPIVEVDV